MQIGISLNISPALTLIPSVGARFLPGSGLPFLLGVPTLSEGRWKFEVFLGITPIVTKHQWAFEQSKKCKGRGWPFKSTT